MSTTEPTRGSVEAVREAAGRDDPDLNPFEKETVFRFSSPDDRVEFYSAEASLIRRLVAHPESDIESVTVREDDRRLDRDLDEVTTDDHVVGVRGSLPVGVLLIKHAPRESGGHANVVTPQVFAEEER
jgi:hypothetical protein